MTRVKQGNDTFPHTTNCTGHKLTRFAAKQIAKKVDRMAKSLGWDTSHYIAIRSTSRYITLRRKGITIRVRISDHMSPRDHEYFTIFSRADRRRLRSWLVDTFGYFENMERRG